MDAWLRIQHFASNVLSTKNHVSILATDFERAFDRVGIQTVLCQVERWGIGPRLYNLIKAFMTNRSFRVRMNNVTSNTHILHNGIPQGSPLSVVIPVTRRVKGYTRFVGKYVTGRRNVSDPIKCIYS